MRAIHNSSKVTRLVPEEAIPLIHALLLYNSPTFLSEDQSERLAGQSYLATVTLVAKNSGLFQPGSECVSTNKTLCKEWILYWKEWVRNEAWRRTAWLVYTLDSLASLDVGSSVNVETRDIHHIPLPCNHSIWGAPTAEAWYDRLSDYGLGGVTLDDTMMCMSVVVLQKDFTAGSNMPLYKRNMGPFARHVTVLTVLRGIIEYGKGKPKGGYITKRYIWPAIEKKGISGDALATHNAIIAHYNQTLNNVSLPFSFVITGVAFSLSPNRTKVDCFVLFSVAHELGPRHGLSYELQWRALHPRCSTAILALPRAPRPPDTTSSSICFEPRPI